MKIGTLYKAKTFHPNLDDCKSLEDLDQTMKHLVAYGQIKNHWFLQLNKRDGWNLSDADPHNNDLLEIAAGQIVMILSIDEIPDSQGKTVSLGLLIGDKRYSASFTQLEWERRFQECGNENKRQ